MYTAMDVYHAPQMKNWRNIIVDSFVRITASRCRYREFLREPDDAMGPRWQGDVRILSHMAHRGARRNRIGRRDVHLGAHAEPCPRRRRRRVGTPRGIALRWRSSDRG